MLGPRLNLVRQLTLSTAMPVAFAPFPPAAISLLCSQRRVQLRQPSLLTTTIDLKPDE